MQNLNNTPAVMPPGIEEIKIYFSQRGMSVTEARQYYRYYEQNGWKNRKGNILKNWKSTAYQWILNILKIEPWRFNKAIH